MKTISITLRLLAVAWLVDSAALAAQDRTDEGFRFAQPGYRFEFPRDHGSHPDYKLEWWYITGHLEEAGGGRSFGFQATFFRYATGTASRPAEIHLAHMALSEPDKKRFLHEERLNRRGWDAGAQVGDLSVTNGNWSLRRTGTGEKLELTGSILGEALLRLELEPAKPLVRFGDDGYSRKGADRTAASLYLTYPRLRAAGRLQVGSEMLRMVGQAWMDHEISSSQLAGEQVGWDWASLQLNDGRELMIYVLRRDDGSVDPHSRLTWIDRGGKLTAYRPDQFVWAALRRWTSPETGARYPVSSRVTTTDPMTGQRVTFELRPRMDAQEMLGKVGGVNYWEGACEIRNEHQGVIGKAFVELTGYDRQLEAVK